jgi:HAD superfamily hydrolase (TIGR01509 family)
MDGLLVDSEPLWFQAESTVMARLQGAWAQDDQDALVGGSMATTVAYLLSKGTRPVEPATVARWLLSEMVSLLRAAPAPVLPGVLDLVAEVRAAGVPYALVTSSEPAVVDAVLTSIDLPFPVVVCAADVARTKPDPEGYLLAAAKLGAEPGQSIALEDSINGVRAAEAAGYRTVAVPSVVPVPAQPGRVVLASLAGVTLRQLAALAGFAI